MANTIAFDSIEEAREFAVARNAPFLVLSQETLDRIEAAEAAGGFEGGQSGASGEGGFSAPGSGTLDSSSSSDPPPIELIDMEGAVPIGGWFEGVIEKALDLHDAWEAFHGNPLGPIILVPREELDRWLGNTGSTA